MEISRPADVRAVLASPECLVPPVPYADAPGTLGWLRAHVARFCNGADHDRRRGLVVEDLAALDVGALREAARHRTIALARAATDTDLPRLVARTVPVAVLASALGVAEPDLPRTVAAVGDVAAAYHPGTGDEAAAAAAISTLTGLLPGPPEPVANRIGLLVQAYAATAGLIDAAAPAALERPDRDVEAVLADALQDNPPVRATRRTAGTGATVGGVAVPPGAIMLLDLGAAGLPFGGGSRPCPGEQHALALAAGVVAALRDGAAQ